MRMRVSAYLYHTQTKVGLSFRRSSTENRRKGSHVGNADLFSEVTYIKVGLANVSSCVCLAGVTAEYYTKKF